MPADAYSMIPAATEQPDMSTAAMTSPARLRRRLLFWYDRHRRVLPWRTPPGGTPDPYRVWLSEIMLQQTTVATVTPYFHDFVARWPTMGDLANADLDQVLHAWQGLGYYARARNLHKCARAVVRDFGGRLPDSEGELLGLPGIGAYTAAAVAAIAYGLKASPVDANVARVVARLYGVRDPLPGARPRLEALAASLTPAKRPGDFAQAMMDLGATVCHARRPQCALCPWREACAARRSGEPGTYPVKVPRKAKPTRRGVAFWVVRGDGAVFLRRRAESGLLGGMMEFPSTDWREAAWPLREARRLAPFTGPWRRLPGVVRHTFTHFHLELTVLVARAQGGPKGGGVWCAVERLSDHALPTVMKKVARHALIPRGAINFS